MNSLSTNERVDPTGRLIVRQRREPCPEMASGGRRVPVTCVGRNHAGRIVNTFQLTGLPHEQFEPLFELPDAQLAALGAVRVIADESSGFPCRVSLLDAEAGEELLLLPYVHQPALSPYNASGPIFVRKGARRRTLAAGEIPSYVSDRLISVRAYDAAHAIIDADVCNGPEVAREIERQFANPLVAYIHLHNAKRGCFSCLVNRA
jgi:Protein of unknown function (DUF1203)